MGGVLPEILECILIAHIVPLGGDSSHLSLFLAENEGRVGKKNNGGQLGRGALCGRWKRRATMSLIGPECGRMLFCALTACAAMGQVTRSLFFCKFSSLSVDAFVSLEREREMLSTQP